MSLVRVVAGALLCVLGSTLGCGQRSGDPVVERAPEEGQTGQAGADSGSAGSGTTTGDSPPEQGPTGLCGSCSSSEDCGDANDACIASSSGPFCGRDCDTQNPCPNGYACAELEGSQLWQCVPVLGCAPSRSAPPALEDLRQYLIERINAERESRARAPLQLSTCLEDLAQSSALAFARTGEPLGKYVKECDPVWPSCACGWNGEAELTVAAYGLDWATAVDEAVTVSRDGPNGRFTEAFLSADATQAGVGFWLSGDVAWIALSLH